MIQEISNFIENIPEDYFTRNLEPSDGLHIWIKLDENGEILEKQSFLVKSSKKKKQYLIWQNNEATESEFPDHLIKREYYSGVISQNKGFDLPAKKIHSSSAFVLWFKKVNADNLTNSFDPYFNKAKTFCEDENIETVKSFCKNNLKVTLDDEQLLKELKNTDYIKIYFDIDLDTIRQGYKKYLGSNLFNKNDYNVGEDEFGLSDFLNGDNVKKIFLMHRTSNYTVNNRISRKEAYNLHLFKTLLLNKPNSKLPNPLPIFIDKEELNKRVIEIYGREGVTKYHEIIKKLIEDRHEDINNYYLINWSKRGGLTINDLDFVSNFKYKLQNFEIKNLFEIRNTFEGRLKNIFQFELEVVQKLFNNLLIQKTKTDEIYFKYFDELDFNPKYMTKTTFNNTLKYRKAFYDFIYKSKREAISKNIFYDLLVSGIIDDIKQDEFKDNYHTKDRSIKEKLNIFFSLNKNFGGEDMASKIPELRDSVKKLLNEEDYHLKDDEEFAFAAGQLIYYIIYQSETANKTHAMLEPYISKNDPALFKLTITRGIEQYKHKFPFGTKKFPKLASEVLGYESKTKIKEMLPILLAGYFSNSLLFDSSNKTKEN